MSSIDKLVFKGVIGNLPWGSIQMNEFINALKMNGWREAPQKGHLYQRLQQRGARLGIKTPNEFARALRDGQTEDAEDGAKKRVCLGGKCWVIFRDNIMITFRDSNE